MIFLMHYSDLQVFKTLYLSLIKFYCKWCAFTYNLFFARYYLNNIGSAPVSSPTVAKFN